MIKYEPGQKWPYKYFNPSELQCKQLSKKGKCSCGGELYYNEDFLTKMDTFRELAGVPVINNSYYRCEQHNKNVGGASRSYHRRGEAFDVRITDRLSRRTIHTLARIVGLNGVIDYDTFVHVDGRKDYYYEDKRK